MKLWVIDDNNNRASIEYFGSEDAARAALVTLKDCYNCTNCTDCYLCYNCTDCRNCDHCFACYDKEGCSFVNFLCNPSPVDDGGEDD